MIYKESFDYHCLIICFIEKDNLQPPANELIFSKNLE
jgi:hypothetical protein